MQNRDVHAGYAKAPQVTDVYAFAPSGRGFTCVIPPRAMPWADGSLALQAALLATFVLPLLPSEGHGVLFVVPSFWKEG